MSPILVGTAIQTAQTINDDAQREEALSALIPHIPDVEPALKFAQALEIPYYQAVALTKLLARLSAEARNNVLQLAMEAIENIEMPRYRIAGWLGLLPQVENPDPIHQKVVEAILDYLWLEKDKRRNNILALCADQQLFSVNILPVGVLREIGEHIMQVCMEWKW